jgi:hypothetical protein
MIPLGLKQPSGHPRVLFGEVLYLFRTISSQPTDRRHSRGEKEQGTEEAKKQTQDDANDRRGACISCYSATAWIDQPLFHAVQIPSSQPANHPTQGDAPQPAQTTQTQGQRPEDQGRVAQQEQQAPPV